jgi:hypothetical protein
VCMAGGDDHCEFFSDSRPKARKFHRCGECGREIGKGEIYRKYFGVYDGSGFSGKICLHCDVLAEWLQINCDGYLFEAIVEDFTEHAHEYQRMDIARLAVMARNDWRSVRKKVLLPVPKCPPPLSTKDAAYLANS